MTVSQCTHAISFTHVRPRADSGQSWCLRETWADGRYTADQPHEHSGLANSNGASARPTQTATMLCSALPAQQPAYGGRSAFCTSGRSYLGGRPQAAACAMQRAFLHTPSVSAAHCSAGSDACTSFRKAPPYAAAWAPQRAPLHAHRTDLLSRSSFSAAVLRAGRRLRVVL